MVEVPVAMIEIPMAVIEIAVPVIPIASAQLPPFPLWLLAQFVPAVQLWLTEPLNDLPLNDEAAAEFARLRTPAKNLRDIDAEPIAPKLERPPLKPPLLNPAPPLNPLEPAGRR